MKISILTPSFNSAKYIERAVQSVLNQDYDNWEHIIVDGGSTDGTLDILKRYPHLKWISEPDKGQSDAMNKAFNMSIGDIIVYLNADDEFEPNIFNKVVEYFIFSRAEILVGLTRVIKNGKEQISDPTIEYNDLRIIRGRFPLNPVSYFYLRKVQENIGDFPINEHYTMDFWFLIRAFHRFKVEKVNLILGTFYFTGENKTSKVDSFNAQRTIAINHALIHDFKRFPLIVYKLYTHSRSKGHISFLLRYMRNSIFNLKKNW